MASYVFSQFVGKSIAFNPGTDVLTFDIGAAADLRVHVVGGNLVMTLGGQSLTLSKTSLARLSTTNIRFADGSSLLVGDASAATKNDDAANTLTGTAKNDQLSGLGGNDTLDGRDGSDTYVVRGTSDGFDRYQDTGTTGVDRIVAGTNNTDIGLAGTFTAATSGIEQISADGHANVRIVGSSNADRLDFGGIALDGISIIDGAGGNDSITGSAGADVIRGGVGNDWIDGGAGRDVAVFAGLKASYAVATAAGVTTVKDLAPKTNGNDGTDTLRNVEVLRFLDGDVVVNPPPTANADGAAASEDGAPVAIGVLANDVGAGLKVAALDTAGLRGSATIDAAGTGVVYDVGTAFQELGAGQTASDVFRYQAIDADGASAWANVTVTVTGSNDGPVASADTASLGEDAAPVSIAVLANDSDPDAGDTLALTGVSKISGGGSFTQIGNEVVFDAGSDFQSLGANQTAQAVAAYTISDAAGALSTAEVTVTVTGSNDGPSAAADTAAITAGDAPVAIDVLANDSDVDTGDVLSLSSVGPSSGGGSFSILGNQLVFDAGTDFAGLAAGTTAAVTASYTISDGAGATSTSEVVVTVTGAAVHVNQPPTAVNDAVDMVDGDPPVLIDVLANDVDPDAGDVLTIAGLNLVSGGGTFAVVDNKVAFDAGSDFAYLGAGESAVAVANYAVVDSGGGASFADVTVTVTGVDDAPVLQDDAAGVYRDAGPTVIDVLVNDYDPDVSDALTLASVTNLTGGGTFTIDAGALVFDPGMDFDWLTPGQSTVVQASYAVTDMAGVESTASVFVTVAAPGPTGPSPFTAIDPAQASANAATITGAILGASPGIVVDAASLAVTAGPSTLMTYDGSLAKLGIGAGLLITSGDMPGTSNTVGSFGIDLGMPGDPALDAVVNTVFATTSYDATSLSFSFEVTDPALTGIKFNAVFGSEEFPEWVDAYVDIGVVLVNGVNVAFFNNDPMAPLSVVSSNLAANYFNDNTGNLDSGGNGTAIPGMPSAYPIEYDGISNVLSIMAPVHLGTNTIKIAIADTGDHILDSGLFISNLMATDVPTSGVVLDHPCTDGSDNETGTNAAESFDAKGGDDVIAAGGGNDVVLGGLGNDTVDGGSGDDFVNGGADDDVIAGGTGDDHLDGGDGIDTVVFTGDSAGYTVIQIGVDQYQVDGADGVDIVGGFEAAQFADGLFDLSALISTGTPGASIIGTADDDVISATASVPGQPFTTALDDLVHGGDGDDIIETGDGADEIFGDDGNDIIDAGAGADLIHGGSGHDELAGGTGADRFIFGGVGELFATAANPDQILDFSSADGDKIDLHLIDADTSTAADDAFALAVAFTGVAGQLVIANAGGESLLVSGDVNGDGFADFGIKVGNVAALNGGDFWL